MCVSWRAFCVKDKCIDVNIALDFHIELAFVASFFASFFASNFPVSAPSPCDRASRKGLLYQQQAFLKCDLDCTWIYYPSLNINLGSVDLGSVGSVGSIRSVRSI